MASFTQITKRKRAIRRRKGGHARKLELSQRSTLSYQELFAACGQPGVAAPKPESDGDKKNG
jgi:hypothetical protein